MSWFVILGIVVVLVLLPTLFGVKPEGTRPAGQTRLMNVARVILLLVAIGIVLATLLDRA